MGSYTPGPWGFDGDTLRGNDMRRIIAYGVEDRDKPILAAAPALVDALRFAVARIELANSEGDMILSAWLPDAKAALAAAGVEVDA